MPAADTSALPEGWISLPDCLLEPRPVAGVPATTILVPMALLHPEFGVALLGVPGAVAEAAAAAFRQRLEDARFPAIFPGHLPVVTLAMLPGEPLNLRRRLAAAFAAVPPLNLAGGDGWITLVSRLLQTRPLIRPPGPRRMRPAAADPVVADAGLPWRSFAPLLGLAGGGLLIGLLVGLSQQPSAPAESGTEAAPRPVASAPPPPRAEVPVPERPPERLPERQAALPSPPPPAVPAPPAAAPPAVEPAPAPALPRVLVRSAANLRAGPDSGAPILRTAPRGEAFRVHGEARGGWIQVGGTAPEGWIHSSLLTEP